MENEVKADFLIRAARTAGCLSIVIRKLNTELRKNSKLPIALSDLKDVWLKEVVVVVCRSHVLGCGIEGKV